MPRTAALARPNRPQGRTTSTTAITTNSATSVKRLNDRPTPKIVTSPMPMHSALISAMISAATNAPGIEPMPPTTTTTNALPIVSRSSDRFADMRGPCNAPPSPARNAPTKKTPVNNQA
jgi:hypothetical protein